MLKQFKWFITFFYTLIFFSNYSEAATIVVGPPPASIQSAIDSASDGDTIQLSSGTYVQEFQVISKSLNIVGAGQNLTIIQSPNSSSHLNQNFNFGTNYWCIAMIDNQAAPTPQIVNISDLTIDGNDQQDTTISPIYGNSDRFFAIGYHNAGGSIENVHTTNTRQTANFNELAGGGIINASSNGTVTFNVNNCLIDFYQRIGIDCRGSSLTANITNSTVNRGYVLTPTTSTATPNGIQFSGLASGSIVNNTVSGNIATVLNASGTGLLPFGAGSNLIISDNIIDNNDYGIAAISCGNNLLINNNIVDFTDTPGINPPEGIIVQDTSGLTTITSNTMNNIPHANMEIISSTDQVYQLQDNQFIGSQTGLIVTGDTTAGPIITMNSDSFSGTSGYYIQEVTAPHDIWPSTASVSFDGLISGHMTFSEFSSILTKIFDQHNDSSLGLVLDFITPTPPSLTSLSPNSGSESGGTLVIITGSNFISSNTQVYFGLNSATSFTVDSDTQITATTPSGTGSVDVTVVTPFGTTPIVSEDQFNYLSIEPGPQVNCLNPNFGSEAGGNIIIINGANFVDGNNQVFFGDSPATQVNILQDSTFSDSQIAVIVPSGTGIVDVTVVTPYGTSTISSADQYTYIPIPPSIPSPPTFFKGIVERNHSCTADKFILKATWNPSPSSNIAFYRIYHDQFLIEEVAAEPPFAFITYVPSKKFAKDFFISAINIDHIESERVKINIKHEE